MGSAPLRRELLVHPLVVVHVHVDETADDPFAAGVDAPRVRGKASRPRGRHGDELAVPDDDDAIGQRRTTGPVDDGAADDDHGRGSLPGRGAGHGEEREGADGEAAQSKRHERLDGDPLPTRFERLLEGTSEARDLRQVIEVRVTREEMQLVLYDKRGDPEIVRRDWGALPAQLVE
jgi:hypothetical protein